MKKSKFQLLNQRITDVKYELNNDYSDQEEDTSDLENIIEVMKHESENKAIVRLETIVNKDFKNKNEPYYISTKIEGIFEWEDMDNIDDLLSQNAPAVLLSYVRSTISQLTVVSGFPPLVLPLLNFKA